MTTEMPMPDPRDPNHPGAPIIPRRDWDLPPWHRWTFQHIRDMTPTAQVWRGAGPVMPMREALEDLGGLAYDFEGRRRTIEAFLDESFTDGFLVLHRGAILTERYFNGMRPHGTHLAMSVTKSIVGILAGIVAGQGLLDVSAPVTRYLPELEATAYRGATVQHVLDMTSGVVFDESYTTPGSHMVQLDLACGWKEHDKPGWPRTMWDLVLSLRESECPHGTRFRYRSIETDVLGFVLERATGSSLAELLSRELWAPMGAGEDAYITVDHAGTALADGGFCATLRDFGRFAMLLLADGRRGGRQIVPAEWIADIRDGKGELFQAPYTTVLPQGAYRNQFWIEDTARRTYLARGIFGQFIFCDPDAEFAAVKLSTWPEFTSPERSLETLAAFRCIRDHVGGR